MLHLGLVGVVVEGCCSCGVCGVGGEMLSSAFIMFTSAQSYNHVFCIQYDNNN